jgi:hypothetical protein
MRERELEGRWRDGASCGGRSAVYSRRSNRTKTGEERQASKDAKRAAVGRVCKQRMGGGGRRGEA